jgi:hypothetical protein
MSAIPEFAQGQSRLVLGVPTMVFPFALTPFAPHPVTLLYLLRV